MHFGPEIFEDVKWIDDELTKINETWCEVVHATKKLAECHSDTHQQKDEKYTSLAERVELFRQKRITLFDLHEQFKTILDNLSRKDRMIKRDASNFFKAVFGIPSSHDYKNLVNNLNLLKNLQNTLVNDTRKLAGSLNLTQMVLKKHEGELDKLQMSLVGFQSRLFVISDKLTFLLEQNGVTYVLLHVDYLLDRLTECETVFCSQITRLHEVFNVMVQGRITPTLVNPEDIMSVLDEIIKKMPVNLQLSFENDFNIWHVYKYSVMTLILHEHEIHLVIKIPLADRDIPVSLIRAYDTPVPLSRNATDNNAYAAGCFCTALAHMVAVDHAESCLFALYVENDSNIQKFCSVRFLEKHLPYVQALTESQWYIATCDQLELAVTCPHRCYCKVLLPPFNVFSLPKFCMGFSAQVKLFPLEKTGYH